MVHAYFETGRLIAEEEQNGSQRAAYGKHLIPELSKYLTKIWDGDILLQT